MTRLYDKLGILANDRALQREHDTSVKKKVRAKEIKKKHKAENDIQKSCLNYSDAIQSKHKIDAGLHHVNNYIISYDSRPQKILSRKLKGCVKERAEQ